MRLLRFHGPGAAGPRLGLEEEGEEEKEEEEEEEEEGKEKKEKKEKEKEGEEKEGGDVVDLSEAEPALPRSMRAFLESGELLAARSKCV
ncbi:histone chaperone ASF1-like [Gallus gallus]|uniref:histone chaperone ASF1-like n=1 Tax=Gallus gallus TaxID=9031 RepID=UPI001AE6EA23|nr:histone chaperone ASF1-like [Gallus gallus]